MIYLVRHGQTEYNAAGRYQGQVDSPLTALGADQARRIGETLARLIDPADAIIFSSTLGRTRQTAAIVARAARIEPILFDPDLMEIGMGSWDGTTPDELDARWPGARDGLDPSDWYFHSPDGETYARFEERLSRALARVRSHLAAHRVIVSHGVAGRVLRGLHAGLDRIDALRLDVPQDALFVLEEGTIRRVECPA